MVAGWYIELPATCEDVALSYRDFGDDVFRTLGQRKVPILKLPSEEVAKHLDEAQSEVFKSWLEHRRYDGLISWIVENFDASGGDKYISQLSGVLESQKDSGRLIRLWKGVIANRTKSFGKPVAVAFTLSPRQAIARESVLWAMNEFCSVLGRLGDVEHLREAQDTLTDFRAGRRRKPSKAPVAGKMNEERFWRLIDACRSPGSTCGEFAERLAEKLEALDSKNIRIFQKLLYRVISRTNTWDHWAIAYIARNGCSDDEFDYFRAWLVTRGKEAHAKVVADYEAGADLVNEDPQCEGLFYAARRAYENRSGKKMSRLAVEREKVRGKEWAEEDLAVRYPRICARFDFPGSTH